MKTLSPAAQKLRASEDALSITQLALGDLATGKVTWFGRAPYRIGVTRPNGAAGGIVIECAIGGAIVGYADKLLPELLAHIAIVITGENTEYNRELLSRRTVLEFAQRFISDMQRAA